MALRNPGNLPQGNGANSIRLQLQGLGDVAGRFPRPPTTDPGGGFFICRQSLFAARNARRPIRSTRGTCASAASARSRSPTRGGRDRIRRPGGAAPPDPGRPALAVALRGLPARRHAPQGHLPAGLDAAAARRPAGRAPGPPGGLDQERRRQPDALVQGPGRVDRAGPRPRAGLRDDRLRLDGQSGQRRGRPLGRGGAGVLRVHPLQPRGAEGPRHRGLRDQPGRRARQLRRRQPPLHRALRRARVGVREHQHAPVLRRGLQDARVRDRRAARLGAPRPGGRADRLGLAVHQDRPRLYGVDRPRAAARASCRRSTAPRRPAARRSPARSRRARTSAGRSSPTRSPSRWPSATRPTAPTRSIWPAAAAARSSRSPTTRSARASGCWPRPPASSPRPPAG